MKLIYMLTFILGYFAGFGQVDTSGGDNNPVLSSAEANYFNEQFKTQRGQFHFEKKKIVFYYWK